MAGGYSEPFEPFPSEANVAADASDLQLHCAKLAPGTVDQWVVGATWGQPAGAPEEAPLIAGGAIAWKDDGGQIQFQSWDDTPVPEDPRVGKESWGAFLPKGFEGTFIGRRFFAKEDNVVPGNPTVNATTVANLNPGFVLVPSPAESSGLSRYDFTNGANVISPQSNSIAGVTRVTNYSGVFQYYGAIDQQWFNEGNSPDDPFDAPQPYPLNMVSLGSRVILFERFYPGQTIAQVQANGSRPRADSPARPATVGDRIAISVQRFIFEQPYIESYDNGYDVIEDIQQGTREYWIYTLPATGESTVGAITANPTQNYGLTISGVEGENVTKTGTIHQLLWHYGAPTRLNGTWSLTRSTTQTGSIARPPNTTGPAHSDGDSPGGAGFPNGWPSKAGATFQDGDWWATANLTKPAYTLTEAVTATNLLNWGFQGDGTYWEESIDYLTIRFTTVPSQPDSITYDTRDGPPPGWTVVEREEAFTFDTNAVFAVKPLFNGVSYVTAGGEECHLNDISEFSNPPGPNEGWSQHPSPPGTCALYGKWSRGNRVTQNLTVEEPQRTGSPPSSPPNPAGLPTDPGSGVPGGGAPGSSPPSFGVPPGVFPDGNWESDVTEEVSYTIDAAIGPTLRSPRTWREAFSTTSNHSADWNGSRSNSSIASTDPVGSYELEYTIPIPMCARSPDNSALTTPEEALFIVQTLNPRTQATPFAPPYPYDTRQVFYQRAGSSPVLITGDIESLFPQSAWDNPEEYFWNRQAKLLDGHLYVYPSPQPGQDYRTGNTTVPVQVYRVDDGSVSPSEVTRKVRSLDAPEATVYDLSASN